MYSAGLHVAMSLLIRSLPFLFRYRTRSKSANLEDVMVGNELRRLLSVSIPRSTGWDGYCIPRASRPWEIPYIISESASQLSRTVAVVLISGLLMAITSGKLSGIQAQSYKQPIWDLFLWLLYATRRTPVTV